MCPTVIGHWLNEGNLSIHSVAVKAKCPNIVGMYTTGVPKLWNDTIEAHRAAVRDAILETTAALVDEHGLASVTMSQIAETTGIGRATLYKYFPDVDTILLAWHEREVTRHLDHLAEARDNTADESRRLESVLKAYAHLHQQQAQHHRHEHHAGEGHHPRQHHRELAAFVHQGEHISRAYQQLHAFIRDLIADAAQAGEVRQDIAPDELATYCIHALAAANTLPSKAAVHRLVEITLSGLRAAR